MNSGGGPPAGLEPEELVDTDVDEEDDEEDDEEPPVAGAGVGASVAVVVGWFMELRRAMVIRGFVAPPPPLPCIIFINAICLAILLPPPDPPWFLDSKHQNAPC